MKTYKYFLFILIFFSFVGSSVSQDREGILKFVKNFSLSAHADAYYGWNTDKDSRFRLFDCVDPIRDEFRLNIAQVSLKYDSDIIRGIVTLHYGDIPKYYWETENPNIQEANIGFKIVNGLWIDAGYFLTHLGAEGLPQDNFLNSNSLPAYYEPFYQSGIKASFDFTENLDASLYLLNGYNVIEDNNKNKSFGMQVNYLLDDNITLTYNNIIGNEQDAGDEGRTRILNNLVLDYSSPDKKIDILLSCDLGTQDKSSLSDSTKTALTYGGLVSFRYHFSDKFSVTLRGDYFQDLDGVYSGVIANNTGIKGNGVTLGLEYKPVEEAYIRIHTRYLSLDGDQKVFYDNSSSRTDVNLSAGFTY